MKTPTSLMVVWTICSLGCGTPRLYDGPRLPPESVSVVSAPSARAKISRIDGQNVFNSKIELRPGERQLEFSWSTSKKVGSLFPVMETECYVKASLVGGHRYIFQENATRESIGRRPPQNFHWTLYQVDPKLIDETTGADAGLLRCNPICRAHGRKPHDQRTSRCEDVLEPRLVTPSDKNGGSAPQQSPEQAALSRIVFDRLLASCARLRGQKEVLCQVRRASNGISYLSADDTLLIFYPSDETNLRPGLRDEARSECLDTQSHADTPACLRDFGWELLR
jgi:hypothetical protein